MSAYGKIKAPRRSRILVVDDHPLYREGLRELINRQADLLCSGEAGTTQEALQACRRERPELVLLDVRLKQEHALDLLRQLQDEFPRLPVLVVSCLPEDLHAERMLKAGARGYVMKECATEEILEAIRTVLAGDLFLSRPLSARLLRQSLQPHPSAQGTGIEQLTAREREVLRLLGAGLKSRDIARKLFRSVKTIASHKENIKQKLDLPDNAALVRRAIHWVENGYL